MVTITDEEARRHEKYTFNFAFEAGIKHNQPDKTNFGVTEFAFEPRGRAEEFCLESASNLLTVHTFENVSTEEYGELHEEIAGVNLTYTCIRLKCPIGETEWQFRGAVASLTEEFPYCVNGVLRGAKPGYEESFIFVTTDQEKTVDLYLNPITTKDITVVRHRVLGERVDQEEPLEDDQTAIITIKRKDFESTTFYPPIEGIEALRLLGKWNYDYEIEINLADDRTILGGYKGNWTVPWDELKTAKEIKFHVVEFPFTRIPERQFEYISQLPETSKKVPKPELI